MVYRFSWIAGIAGIAFALARAERLLRSSSDGLPWELMLIAAAIIGAAITWAGMAYGLRSSVIAAINAVAAVITVVRVAVPETTWYLFPTPASFSALGDEMVFARDVIRTGIAPVIPLAGIVAILALVFWGMGALLTWGLLSRKPYVAVLTPLIVYLEFAVMDRRPSGAWTTAFMVLIGFALIAVSVDRRREGTGLLTHTTTRRALVRTLPSIGLVTLAATLVVAVVASNAVAGLVPRSGVLEWRARTGLSGDFYGSISYNPFVGIRQQLISQTNTPIFVATVQGDLSPADVYWRLLTLDSFDGTQWHLAGGAEIARPEDLDAFEDPDSAFAGDVATVTSEVTILALQQDWLPAPYSPVAMTARNNAVDRGYRVKSDDASLRFDALSYRGLVYSVRSEVPVPDLDVLGRLPGGEPSVVFGGAIQESEFALAGEAPVIEERTLEDEERYLELPEEIDPRIRSLARTTTRNLETDFERGLALEAFFRTPGNFAYSTAIVPGHGATDLADWLLDPESENYRIGYCEQFSTSMAVMARMLGIPSRVVLGFTPGTLLEDGRVVVRDRNAHAWVELWMPSQGWVRFDPTPRADGINPATTGDMPFDVTEFLDVPEPEVRVSSPGPNESALLREEGLEDQIRVTADPGDEIGPAAPLLPGWAFPAIAVAAVVLGLVPLVKWARRRLRIRRLKQGSIDAAWREIVDRLSDLGDPPAPALTARETALAAHPDLSGLADVYGEWAYGSVGGVSPDRVLLAQRSLSDGEQAMARHYSMGRRLWSQYSLSSLAPSWWRRFRGRRYR